MISRVLMDTCTQHNGQKKRKKDKQPSTKHYTENERSPKNPTMNSGAPEWQAVPVPRETPVVLLLLQTQ